jgi:hypothetical protein
LQWSSSHPLDPLPDAGPNVPTVVGLDPLAEPNQDTGTGHSWSHFDLHAVATSVGSGSHTFTVEGQVNASSMDPRNRTNSVVEV